jgi:hypothetical protein
VTPTSKEPNGTYGRFRYIPSKNVFIAVNRTSENVYFYRLTSGTGTPVPTLSFTAAPASITAGASATLSWSSSGADTCIASDGWLGSKPTAGSERVSPTSTSAYTLSCSGAGTGSAIRSVTVTVTSAAVPTVSLSASPAAITSGSSSTLSWSSTNASACNASGDWTGPKATAGNQSMSPTTTSTYTLSCTGTGGSANQSVTVTVDAASGGGTTSSGGGGAIDPWWLVGLALLWRSGARTQAKRTRNSGQGTA